VNADGEDEVARQRRKHWAKSLSRPVPDFPAMTLRQVVADALAASDEASGALDVAEFLTDQGHSQATIQTVQGYLDLERATELREDDESSAAVDWASGDRRLRAVEQLEAMLLED
jgi:hypothetical protein